MHSRSATIALAPLLSLAACATLPRPDFWVGPIEVYRGEVNRPAQADVAKWTIETEAAWLKYDPSWGACIKRAINLAHAKFVDDDTVIRGTNHYGHVVGLVWMVMALQGSQEAQAKLYRHELSHIILWQCGVKQVDHHATMTQAGLR